MKKIFLTLLLVLVTLLVGCGNDINNPPNIEADPPNVEADPPNVEADPPNDNCQMELVENIYFKEVERYDINWERIQFPIQLNENELKHIKPINDIEIAIEVGQNILKERQKNGRDTDYSLIFILHSIEDNVWRFDYTIDQRNTPVEELIFCGGLYVIIDGVKGELIVAWVDE